LNRTKWFGFSQNIIYINRSFLCPSGVSPDGLDLHWIPPSERLPLPGSRQVLQAGRDHAGMTIPVLKSLYNPLILTISLLFFRHMKNSVKKLKHSLSIIPLEKMMLNEASEQAFRKIYLSGLLLKLFMIMKTSAYEKQRQKTKALSVKNENTV
jgi:hypothetical protein